MKILKDILYKVSLNSVFGKTDIEIDEIYFDSRLGQTGGLFVATTGTQSDGHSYIESVIEKGCIAIVCQVLPLELKSHVTYIQVANSNLALGIIAANFYDNPSHKLKLVGITGTNGKTTTATLLFNLFRELGYSTALLSTVENRINDDVIPSTHTTPDPVSLNKLMAKMVDVGCTHCFIEVSSHSVVQHRISGLQFDGAVFTNITHDHLDYHKTFEEYIKAKKGFFDLLPAESFALVNVDDKRGMVMLQNTKASKNTYALNTMANFKAKVSSNSFSGLEMEIDGTPAWFKLIGSFNAYNILSVYATAILLGEDKLEVLTQLSNLDSAKGRFDRVVSKNGVIAIIDYAHTPDALENILGTINDIRQGKEQLITVIGCGGNRDTTKRPIMADIATKKSDRVILTADNPRNEEPEAILAEMESGISISNKRKALTIVDRKEAIKTALMLSKSNDIVLIAGKGHENYQEIKGVKHPFDDKQIVIELFNLLQI